VSSLLQNINMQNKISNFILQIGTWQITDRTWVKKVYKALGLGLPNIFFNPW
jgi:diketogulonate reductase-like aldo/keto reductase